MSETQSNRTFTKVNSGSGGNLKFIRPKQLADDGIRGVVAEGIYEGTQPNTFEPTRNDFKVVSEDGALTTILNANGSLNSQMAKVEAGSYVRISYNGMKKVTKGKLKGKEVHDFTVEVAE